MSRRSAVYDWDMRLVGHLSRMTALRAARGTTTVVLALCVGLACSTNGSRGTDDRDAPDPTREASASVTDSPRVDAGGDAPAETAPDQRRAALPAVPDAGEPALLAEQLTVATATMRDPGAFPADVRRAGQFQQLAVRSLAAAPARVRRAVLARLEGQAAAVTRACLRAAQQLGGITAPQRALPRWRIVAPPSPRILPAYNRAAPRRTGLHWTYLAAINLVETRMGRIRGTSTAGAQGPMQFLPATWELYGAGGDINDPRDAILAAGRLLRANGAPGDMAEAQYHYNPSQSYVRAVSEYAGTMRRFPSAYLGYWHWRVLYRHVRGTYVLSVGYPRTPAELLPE